MKPLVTLDTSKLFDEVYVEKTKEMDGLVNVIKLYARPLLPKEKQESDNIEGRLEFRLKELINECKLKELDLKIESMKNIIKLLKNE